MNQDLPLDWQGWLRFVFLFTCGIAAMHPASSRSDHQFFHDAGVNITNLALPVPVCPDPVPRIAFSGLLATASDRPTCARVSCGNCAPTLAKPHGECVAGPHS